MKTIATGLLLAALAVAQPIVPLPAGAIKCAEEWQTCSFSGSQEIYYGVVAGSISKFIHKTFVNIARCASPDFGGDPFPGKGKSCYTVPAAPAPTPVPTPPPPASTVVLTGAAPPTAATGTAGNFYVQFTSGLSCLWGPKSVTAWPATCVPLPSNCAIPPPPPPPAPAPSSILLPIEVVGPDGTTDSRQITLPTGTNLNQTLKLAMTIENLTYQTMASVQINNSGWVPLDEAHVTLLGQASAWGGIGGGFAVLDLTIPIPPLTLIAGANTVAVRFNATNGVSSGLRVIKLNVFLPDGTRLLPQSAFAWDDVTQWKPPLNTPADITAGKNLFQNADLADSSIIHPGAKLQARCSSCHAQDGRDLKYYNYSNTSIRARAIFHRLTPLQGDQIASYIRSLPGPAPGRPWNPPYQPGPGLDAKPISDWAAGAGLDAVLDSEPAMMTYLAPGGDTSNWAPNGNVSAREIPISFQFPTWNRWLPTIHPLDAWGALFTNSNFKKYLPLRAALKPGDAASYVQSGAGIIREFSTGWYMLQPLVSPPAGSPPINWTPQYTQQIYSTLQWLVVKDWEVNQEFQLEGMSRALKGPKADDRSWTAGIPFFVSPNFNHIPIPPGSPFENSQPITWYYFAHIWYQEQLSLNPTDFKIAGRPIDWPYVYGFIKNLSLHGSAPQASTMLLWLIKSLQTSQFDGGPELGIYGWHPGNNSISLLVDPNFRTIWQGYTIAQRTTYSEAYLKHWFAGAKQFTAQQWYQGGWASPSDIPINAYNHKFADAVFYALPHYRILGVDKTLTDAIADWAKTVWPAGNWDLTKTKVCTMQQTTGEVSCPGDAP